ncbi:Ribosomal large subunit pseudouridine synthase C [Pigmentiphaga humi]|uniref:Pseudouridine synthase n=1 Tax=Pigmentiphaga humi TaxID=2478468 RepID=A0A3P4B941_9BURK|nr:RluA family pseudouridine synthase [Pigmentiphaga humi]VCU72120.1 Ribosomal large subunit pseudouridine synthase C [Pigmentiphaga humi]
MSLPLLRKAKSSAGRDRPARPPQAAPAPAVRLVEVDESHHGQRLDNFLLRLCKGVPKSHLYKAIRGGEVRVNKGRVAVDHRIESGDLVRVPPFRLPEVPVRFVPPSEFPIVFEDDALLAIDKPAGVAVHGGSGVDFGVIEQLRRARPQAKFLELVHRLDRDTSGLLLVAKKRNALVGLHQSLRDGLWNKHYLAMVAGDWVNDRQHVRKPLLKWTTQSGERRVRVDQDGQPAHTIFVLRQRYGAYSLLDAELKTGRTHQIRVHLLSCGFPIVGDDKYGDEAANAGAAALGFRRMFLHAHTLCVPHPLTGEALAFQADLPQDCLDFIKKLENP